MREPKFKILDRVFHVTGTADVGVVIDGRYCMRTDSWSYEVAFTPMDAALWYYEQELSDKKVSK